MTTFIRAKLKKLEHRVASNITEYHIKNLPKNHHSKFMMIKQLFHVKKWTSGLFGHKYKVATLSIFYPTVSGIIIMSFKSLGQV